MTRLVTALALIAVAIYLIFFAPTPIFMGGALCFSLLCYLEFSGLVARYGIPNPGVFGVLAGVVILFWPQYTLLGMALLIVVVLSAALGREDAREILPYAACLVFGTLYCFAPWRFAADLRHIGIHLLFFALALNWIGDTAAYFVGRRFGRHKLAPMKSPQKSWEGAIASVVVSMIFGVLYLEKFMPQIPWWEVTGLALAGNIAGQFGDLAESAIKRGAGVKDSGTMLPGHGGMLDRVDSALFALPVVYGLYLGLKLLP